MQAIVRTRSSTVNDAFCAYIWSMSPLLLRASHRRGAAQDLHQVRLRATKLRHLRLASGGLNLWGSSPIDLHLVVTWAGKGQSLPRRSMRDRPGRHRSGRAFNYRFSDQRYLARRRRAVPELEDHVRAVHGDRARYGHCSRAHGQLAAIERRQHGRITAITQRELLALDGHNLPGGMHYWHLGSILPTSRDAS